ncbi:class I SAM-dependent methyltransferase [Pedobacter frigidisoli]|uniref:Class I SAM-dependent methyltransferase n=1 Tax=Pedobacter frigidisoli TaxID=2530455 RepID=A0A4R0NZT1_9SPHI|nr:class I SAM-dependent methyltransferase [Pedobacter frigidisoli]TCD07705.1 class I SAM-dependent methyltransferase [Pedobacter frigidisoli]
MQIRLYKLKNKLRRTLYNAMLSKYGFGNRVSKSIWDTQFQSGFWDYLYSADEKLHYQLIAELVKQQSKETKLLDVGCGQGVLYSYLKHNILSSDYLGIDISDSAISLASASFPESRFLQVDFDHQDLDEKFDLIIFNESLYYFNQPLRTIEKCIAKNLNEKGALVISMCDFKGHDIIWQKLQTKYQFRSLTEIENDKNQKWRVGVFKP